MDLSLEAFSGNKCDFVVWTCHKLAIPTHLNGIELTDALDAQVLGGGFDGVTSARIHSMPKVFLDYAF